MDGPTEVAGSTSPGWPIAATRAARLRVDRVMWDAVRAEVFDYTTRERAGVLLVKSSQGGAGEQIIVAVGWVPVDDRYVRPSRHGLSFDGRFLLRVADAADQLDAGALLVHAHPGQMPPRPSLTDIEHGASFVTFMRRRRPDSVNGLLIISDRGVAGVLDGPDGQANLSAVTSVGIPLREWTHETDEYDGHADEDDRQLLAIGTTAQHRLSKARVAVVGNSGGGSHVTQQLIHAGVGTLVVIDPDIVTSTNLRRLVGAVEDDVSQTLKVNLAKRIAAMVRPSVTVEPYPISFPSTDTMEALRDVDIIIGCVDGWDTRAELNQFALQHRIPYIDIGIQVSAPTNTTGMCVGGQIVVVTPDGPCMRCMGLVTDARIEQSRHQRQYADGVIEPQVVSLNGTVASEAVTAALMLLAGDDRIERYRRYAYPPGQLSRVSARRRAGCPACAAAYPIIPEATELAPEHAVPADRTRTLRQRLWDSFARPRAQPTGRGQSH